MHLSTLERVLIAGFLFVVALASIILLRWDATNVGAVTPAHVQPAWAPWRA